MTKARDGAYIVMTSMTDKLLADFDYTKVSGLTENPIITKTVTPRTPEPYIYFHELDSNEIWVTKEGESREYTIIAQVVVRNEPGRGTAKTRDEISNQVIENLTDQSDFPDPSGDGYRVQRVVTGDIVKYETMERGGKFYISNIPILVTAYYHGFDFDVTPVASQVFSYSGWDFTPSGLEIEDWDSGTITSRATDFPDSNGWSVTSTTVAKSAGGTDGTLSGRVLSVSRTDENIGLTTTFNWEAISDNTQTTTTTDTDNFRRIKSFRYGALAGINNAAPVFADDFSDTYGLRNLEDFNDGARRTIDFRNVNPIGDSFSVTVNAGEYIYLIYGSDQHELDSIEDDFSGDNILTDVFSDPVIIGDYRIYISKSPANYDDTTYNYTAG